MRKSPFIQSEAENKKQEAVQNLAKLIKKYSKEFKNMQKKIGVFNNESCNIY